MNSLKLLRRYIHVLTETKLGQKYYHGSSRAHKIGSIIKAVKSRPTEFSDRISTVDNISVEDFVEQYRPPNLPSRLQCIFMVDDVADLNMAGASEDYVYEVEPVGTVASCDFGWFQQLLGIIFDQEEDGSKIGFLNNPEAIKMAKMYWNGKPSSYEGSHREFLASQVKIVRQVGAFKEEFPFRLKSRR